MSGLLAAVHMAKARLGMDDADYRALLLDAAGVDTLKGSSPEQQRRVLEVLRKRQDGRPQMRKLRKLWIIIADNGIVRNRGDRALAAYVRRMAGATPDEASDGQLRRAIESLKRWMTRCGRTDLLLE